MDLRIFTEPQQGATYDDLLAVARAPSDLGFDGFFRSDHYLHMGASTVAPGPTDAWTTLAGLARDTSTIRLGTLVTSATFRLPGPLAIQVAHVDQMCGGRVELGLGAGGSPAEHAAYGIPFPPLGERFDRLEEQLAVITGLWATRSATRSATTPRTIRSTDSPALPKPVQRGGVADHHRWRRQAAHPAPRGAVCRRVQLPRSPRLPTSGRLFERVREVAGEAGRDPATLTLSAAQVVCLGNDDATLARRAAAIGRDSTSCAPTA